MFRCWVINKPSIFLLSVKELIYKRNVTLYVPPYKSYGTFFCTFPAYIPIILTCGTFSTLFYIYPFCSTDKIGSQQSKQAIHQNHAVELIITSTAFQYNPCVYCVRHFVTLSFHDSFAGAVMAILFVITGWLIIGIGYQVGKIYRKYCGDIIKGKRTAKKLSCRFRILVISVFLSP